MYTPEQMKFLRTRLLKPIATGLPSICSCCGAPGGPPDGRKRIFFSSTPSGFVSTPSSKADTCLLVTDRNSNLLLEWNDI